MRAILMCYFLLVGILCVTARSSGKGSKRLHKKPLYRSIEDITTTANEDIEVPKISTKTKLIVIKARSNEANEGRFLKHILLLRQFMQPQYGGYNYPQNNYPNNYPNNNNNGLPYIIINNPTNLTNVNNNTLTNVPTATAAAAAAAAAAGAGLRNTYLSNSQALPYALPAAPTQVYQQRQQAVPQVVYGPPINAGNFRIRNRIGDPNQNRYENDERRRNNPFSIFSNNLKRITFI